jgi:plastocyanin
MLKLPTHLMASGFLALLLAASSAPDGALGADIDWSKAETVTVKLTDFEYSPAYLRFHTGSPVRLILVNQGTGKHDFSAPEFFSAVTLRPGSSAPAEGTIDLAKNETKEVDLLPVATGNYKLKCTHFLHSLFGMHGVIEVVGGPAQ